MAKKKRAGKRPSPKPKDGTTEAPHKAPAPKGKQSSRRRPREEHPFEIRDGLTVLNAARAHRDRTRKFGLTDADLAKFAAQIETAKQYEGVGGRVSLDGARHAVKDLLGDYRTAARLAASSLDGRDESMIKRLRVDLPFPDNDGDLDDCLKGLDAVVKKNAAALVNRDFTLEQQAAFLEAASVFHSVLQARPDEQAALAEKAGERVRAFAALRTMTSYVRELGRAALRKSAKRSDFDRPKQAKKPKKTPPATDPPK